MATRAWLLPVVLIGVLTGVLVVACGEAKAPRFRAACAPDDPLEKVVCTVENVGTARGRACLTAVQDPPEGASLVARRACTGWLEPGATTTVVPRFDLGLGKCATLQPAEWICKGRILETAQGLGENIPPEAPAGTTTKRPEREPRLRTRVAPTKPTKRTTPASEAPREMPPD